LKKKFRGRESFGEKVKVTYENGKVRTSFSKLGIKHPRRFPDRKKA